jgi:hypothetical protein
MPLLEILRGLDEDKKGEVKELLEQSFHHQTIYNDVVMNYCTLYRGLRSKGEHACIRTLVPFLTHLELRN